MSNWKSAIGEVTSEWDKFQKGVDDKAKKAPEGNISIQKKVNGKWIDNDAEAEDDTPIMPTFAEGETPEAKAAREKAEELEKRLNALKLDKPPSSSSTYNSSGGGGGALSKMISAINNSTKDKTVEAIHESNSLLAEAIDAVRANKIQTREAG